LRERSHERERMGYGFTLMCTNTHTHTHTHTHTCMGITQTQDELKKFAGIRRDIEDGILSPEKLDAAKKEVGGCAVEKCAVVK
jgi:hypothetical protein